jgi:hypothetical protein
MPVRTRIALGTLCMANMLTVAALGFVALFYVDGAAGPGAAVALWVAAAGLWRLAAWLRRGTDW